MIELRFTGEAPAAQDSTPPRKRLTVLCPRAQQILDVAQAVGQQVELVG